MQTHNTETDRPFSIGWLPFFMAVVFLMITGRAAVAKIVTDQLGREIVLVENPRKIVSLAPSITEIIFALGQEDRLVGVTKYSDYPPAAKKLPRIGTYIHLDLERVVALQPDLCIAIKDGNPRSVIEKLDSLGIPVYAVDPRDLDSVMETTLEIGVLLSAEQQAAGLVREMRARVQSVKARVEKADHTPKVFFQIGISPVVSVGTNTFIHVLIVSAGGENLSKGPVPYPRPTK
jgi:iron complex transport system substrate-binding protein